MQAWSPSIFATDHRHVLIVEDEKIAREAMTSLLRYNGFSAQAFGSAEEALAHVNSKTPAIVALIDVDLPGMNGLDLVERLERLQPGMTAVLITAVEGDRIKKFRRNHTVGYMRKPVDFDRLLSLLNHADDNESGKPPGNRNRSPGD